MPRILGCVFARGGSKGLPGKNIRPLCGTPLIGHAVQAALGSRWLDRVVVSTDSPEIARVAREYGAETPFLRPSELSTDSCPERLAWRHAIESIEAIEGGRVDILVSVPATCPLRYAEDVNQAVEALLASDESIDMVLTVTESSANPYFSMVTLDEHGLARLAVSPPGLVTRRQDAPDVFTLTAVAYAARRNAVLTQDSIFQGRVRTVMVPPERAVDIDSEFDFQFAEFLLQRRIRLQRTDREKRSAA